MKSELNRLKSECDKEGKEFKRHEKLNYKNKGLVILKRLLKGGISSQLNCICNGSPFLFFDIDVKLNENSQLYTTNKIPNPLNNSVFEYLKTIALITARSASGIGIFGILYVPSLIGINNNRLHKSMGISVYDYINKELELPINIEFDTAQAQFTQGRSFPVQFSSPDNKYSWNIIELNKNALEFKIESNEVKTNNDKNELNENKTTSKYIYTSDEYNSEYNKKELIRKYNREYDCIEIFLENIYEISKDIDSNGYTKLQKIGKDNSSISVSSSNTFRCWSGSIQGYTPFDLLSQFNYNGNSTEAHKHVQELYTITKENNIIHSSTDEKDWWSLIDFEDKFYQHPLESIDSDYCLSEINQVLNSTNEFTTIRLNDLGELIFETSTTRDLLGITDRDIELSLHHSYKADGYEYPIYDMLKDSTISTDIKIDNFITPQLIADNCTSPINYVYSGCGCGKTTAFLGKDEPKINGLAKDCSVLFVVPRK